MPIWTGSKRELQNFGSTFGHKARFCSGTMDEDELFILSDKEKYVNEHRVQMDDPPGGPEDDDDDLAALDAEMEALMSSEKSSHKSSSDHGGSGKQIHIDQRQPATEPPVCALNLSFHVSEHHQLQSSILPPTNPSLFR